jgi:hypothetical protein
MEQPFLDGFLKADAEARESMIAEETRQLHLAKEFCRYEKAERVCRDERTKALIRKCKMQTIKLMERR